MTVFENACANDPDCKHIGTYFDQFNRLIVVYDCDGVVREYYADTGEPVVPLG